MSRSTKRWIARLLGTVAFVAGVPAVALYLREIVTLDPFASYRAGSDNPWMESGITVNQATVRHWSEGKLVSRTRADSLTIRADRQVIAFRDATGEVNSEQGRFHFSAQTASWNAIVKNLDCPTQVRIWNDDLDLIVPGFKYSQSRGKLDVPGQVRGKLYGGDFSAQDLVYFVETDRYETGPIRWVGERDDVDLGQEKRSGIWDVSGKKMRSLSRDVVEYTEGVAKDSEGEIIVKANVVQVDRKTDVVTAKGNVRYYGLEANLTADQAVVYRKEKRTVLTGNVRMLVKPEDKQVLEEIEIPPIRPLVPDEVSKSRPPAPVQMPPDKAKDDEIRDPATRRKYPILLSADRVEYWYAEGSRRGVATGSPNAFQQLSGDRWRHMWAFRAEFDGERDELQLFSQEEKRDVRFKSSLGDDLTAKWFRVLTKDDSDEWEGDDVVGKVYVDDEGELPRSNRGGGGGAPPPSRTRA